MSNYRKTMADALREMYPLTEETQLDEGTIDKVKEIASKKQAMKIDGVMVDSFTASAISQIYDKVNDANKKKMEKLPITKLANLAMKMMQKNEFVPEEVELDEAEAGIKVHAGPDHDRKVKRIQSLAKQLGAKVTNVGKSTDGKMSTIHVKGSMKVVNDLMKLRTEEAELDEDFSVEVPKQKIAGKTYGGGATVIVKAKTASQAIKMVAKRLGVDVNLLKTGKVVKEEVELDEALQAIVWKTKPPKGTRRVHPRSKWPGMKPDDIAKTWPSGKAGVEEVDLDENRMSQLHQMIKDKKSAEEIAKMMKLDVKTIKALMSSHHPEDVEEGAAADARRAMSKDKDLRRGKDSADVDDNASDDDVKGASKNIIMQMRKAQSLSGNFAVEFGDGKKVKIPAKMAVAVQKKYNSMKKPADKEKFQAQIAKSYKDMLKTLKAGYGEQKESILERMNRKIKENKDG